MSSNWLNLLEKLLDDIIKIKSTTSLKSCNNNDLEQILFENDKLINESKQTLQLTNLMIAQMEQMIISNNLERMKY